MRRIQCIGAVLVLLGVVLNPITAKELVFWGYFPSILLVAILWFLAGLCFCLGATFICQRPSRLIAHFEQRAAEYMLLVGTLVVGVGLIEVWLRLPRPSREPKFVKNLEFEHVEVLNDHGFRDDPFREERTPGVRRGFLIGDSFVHGVTVAAEDKIDVLLEKELLRLTATSHEVFALGLPGIGPEKYAQIGRDFANYEPDFVVVSFYVENDIQEPPDWAAPIRSMRIISFLANFSFRGCVFHWTEDLSWVGAPVEPRIQEAACKGLINPWLLAGGDPHQRLAEYEQLFLTNSTAKDSILALRDTFSNVPFLLVLHPSKFQVATAYFELRKGMGPLFSNSEVVNSRLQTAIMRWAQSEEIRVMDMLPILSSTATRTYHIIDDHYNEVGNRVVAKALAEDLISTMAPGSSSLSTENTVSAENR